MAEHDDITNALDDNGFTPLHEAAESNSIEDLEELLAGGANPNAKESLLNQTPLHRAAMAGSKDAAERLLQAGADPNIRDVDGDTPLHAALKDPASEDKHLATVSSLISHGARLDLPDKQSGRTPLSLAVASNKIKTAERLLEERVHPNTTDKEGNTTLHLAAARSSAVTQQLLLAGASPHIRNPKDHTPLHQAAMNGKADAAARLLDAGADPNSRTKSGQTPLHFAANGRSPETVGRLIEAGADPSARNDLGSTPLHSAALANCTKSIDRLLKAGADLKAHVPDKLGTPLELARKHQLPEATAQLARAETERNSAARTIGRRLFQHIAGRQPQNSDEKDRQTTISATNQQQRMEKPMPQEHWSNRKSARQFTQQVSDRVGKQINDSQASWQKGYDKPKGADHQPFNPATMKRFKGLNAVHLRSVAQEKGYNDPRWMSFQAANRIGAKIKKGERGTRVESLHIPPKAQSSQAKEAQGKDTPNGASAGDKQKEQPNITHRTYVVFNAEQIERMPALEKQLAKEPQQHEICERAERMIQDSGVKLESPPNGQSFSNYDKNRDTIVIPEMEKFKSPEAYYSQAAKEMAGRAGHEQQKNRPEPQSEAQQLTADARHDMRREMACQTISAKLHLPKEPTGERHKAQWAETLRNNPNELRYAARDADRMADKVLQHDRPQQRQQAEPAREAVAAPATPERMRETQQQLQQPQRELTPAMNR